MRDNAQAVAETCVVNLVDVSESCRGYWRKEWELGCLGNVLGLKAGLECLGCLHKLVVGLCHDCLHKRELLSEL